jgi:hypothetical protein
VVRTVAGQALLFDELLARDWKADRFAARFRPAAQPMRVHGHGHCQQKAFGAMPPMLDTLRLIPGAAPDASIVADGTSCRRQIADGAAREALHVARVLSDYLACRASARGGAAFYVVPGMAARWRPLSIGPPNPARGPHQGDT